MEDCVKLYMILHEFAGLNTKTHLSHTLDVHKALLQHNRKLPGGPRLTRRAAGHWKLALVIVLPKHRDLLHKELVEYWKKSSRKHCRLEFGIRMARKLKVPWFVNSEIFSIKAARGVIPDIAVRYFERKRTLSRDQRRRRYEAVGRRLFKTRSTDSNTVLKMSVGRKRAKRTIDIGFTRSWTGMTPEQRMRLLSKRAMPTVTALHEDEAGAQQQSAVAGPGRAATMTSKAMIQSNKVQQAPLASVLSSLWLGPAIPASNKRRRLTSQNVAVTSTTTYPVAAVGSC